MITAQPVRTNGRNGKSHSPDLKRVRNWIVEQILGVMTEQQTWERSAETTRVVSEHFMALCKRANLTLPETSQQQLYQLVVDEILGYGPIQPFIDNPEVSEVMVNGPDQIYVERNGLLTVADARFDDEAHVLRIAQRIIGPLGRTLDRKQPRVDARLPDGSRVNVIIPPCSIDGPSITIRKFPEKPLTVEDLIRFGSIDERTAEFLRACVHSALNIVVSGGTGSGKTTLLNVLSSFIPENERIVTIEDAAELQLLQPHVVRLETAPALSDGSGRVSIRDLVINSLRMRPDRIVVGECRGGEALDMLQAMNTGHDGSLTTIHANSPRDCIARLETLCLMAGFDLPIIVVRKQIASAVDLIVQQARMRDGSRKILQVTEVQGMEGETVVLQDIFLYKNGSSNGNGGGGGGQLEPVGIRPRFMGRLEEAGVKLGADVFGGLRMDSMRR
jgi:pilus assembly protein CpaF